MKNIDVISVYENPKSKQRPAVLPWHFEGRSMRQERLHS